MNTKQDQEVRDLQAFLKDRVVSIDIVALIAHFEDRIRRLEDDVKAAKADRRADAQVLASSMFSSCQDASNA